MALCRHVGHRQRFNEGSGHGPLSDLARRAANIRTDDQRLDGDGICFRAVDEIADGRSRRRPSRGGAFSIHAPVRRKPSDPPGGAGRLSRSSAVCRPIRTQSSRRRRPSSGDLRQSRSVAVHARSPPRGSRATGRRAGTRTYATRMSSAWCDTDVLRIDAKPLRPAPARRRCADRPRSARSYD